MLPTGVGVPKAGLRPCPACGAGRFLVLGRVVEDQLADGTRRRRKEVRACCPSDACARLVRRRPEERLLGVLDTIGKVYRHGEAP